MLLRASPPRTRKASMIPDFGTSHDRRSNEATCHRYFTSCRVVRHRDDTNCSRHISNRSFNMEKSGNVITTFVAFAASSVLCGCGADAPRDDGPEVGHVQQRMAKEEGPDTCSADDADECDFSGDDGEG